jgi:hypothetical protein
MTLLDYLNLSHRWAWGGVAHDNNHHYCDCTLYAGDWCRLAYGVDPGKGLRGTYADRVAANAIVEDAGGMIEFVGGRLSPLGFKRVQNPQDGDIGIVSVMTGFDFDGATVKEIPAIRFGPLWSVMSARGAMTKKLEYVAAWRFAA